MRKLWVLARSNILKAKSVSVILIIMFMISALLLNIGLLVFINYGSHFKELQEELSPSNAYFLVPDALYNDEIKAYIENVEHIKNYQTHKCLVLGTEVLYQDKEQSFAILFNNMDEERTISKWKYIDEHLSPEDMSVYVPDIFKAVSNYELNDKIELKYVDENGEDKSLNFTVKGYVEDIYFSSTDTGVLGFYLPHDTYEKVQNMLTGDMYQFNVIYTNVDDISNVSAMENDMREILNLNSASLMSTDTSTLFFSIDIELVELSRCMMASMVSVMMVVFALVIVAVCLLVVRFRIVNSIEDDVVKIGSLKGIGYTSKQIASSILLQFLFLTGIGSIVGIAISYPFLPAISVVFERQSGLKWVQGFDGTISLMALLALLIVVTSVTIWSSRHIRKLNPIDGLRGQFSKRKYKRNYIKLENTKNHLILALAFKSIMQNIKQNIMMTFILIAVAFSGVFGVIMYYNTSIDTKAFAEVPGMEVCNSVATLNPQKDQTEALKAIQNMPHVRKTLYLDEVKAKIDGSDATVYITEDYSKKESILVYEGKYPKEQGEVALAGVLAERLNKKIGDTVIVETEGKKEIFKVVGLSNGASMGGVNSSMLTSDYKKLNPDFKPQSLNIYLDKDTDVSQFIKNLETDLDKEVLMGAINFDKLMAEGMASYQNIVALMGVVMLVITIFIVFLVLYFMISSSVIRKKRELGIQKAIGFTTFQLMNQISINFMIPIGVGTVIGSLLGAFYTNALMSIPMKGMGIMKAMFIVDAYWIIAFAISTIILAYILSLLITWRIRKISAYELVTE